jgi:hypothetical protein
MKRSIVGLLFLGLILLAAPALADEPVTAVKTADVAKTDEVGPLIPYRTLRSKVSLLIPYRARGIPSGIPGRFPAHAKR